MDECFRKRRLDVLIWVLDVGEALTARRRRNVPVEVSCVSVVGSSVNRRSKFLGVVSGQVGRRAFLLRRVLG